MPERPSFTWRQGYIAELHGRFPALEQQATILEAVDETHWDEREPFTIDFNDFSRARDAYSDYLDALYGDVTRVSEQYNKFLEAQEAFDAWFEQFADGPLREIYQRDDEVSVDTVSLDKDHQRFLEAWQPIIHAQREYVYSAANALNDYADLADLTNDLAKRLTVLDEALHGFAQRHEHGKTGTINIRPRDNR